MSLIVFSFWSPCGPGPATAAFRSLRTRRRLCPNATASCRRLRLRSSRRRHTPFNSLSRPLCSNCFPCFGLPAAAAAGSSAPSSPSLLHRPRAKMTGSRKRELKSEQKLEKKLSFYKKVKDTVASLNAKKAISKKRKQRSCQKKLKAYDFSALSELLPATTASQQQTEVKLNCKSKQALVQRESAQLNAVLNNPQFQLDPFTAIHQHLVSTQPPSLVKDDDSAKHVKKSRKDKKRKKKNASSTPQSMDI